MPVRTADFITTVTAEVSGPLAPNEVEPLAKDPRVKTITVRANEPPQTWEIVDEHLFSKRPDVILTVDSLASGGADLTLLRRVPSVRRLCVTSPGKEELTSLESIASLPELESLQIGSPSLRSFDVLNLLPTDRLLDLRLAYTDSHQPSLKPVSRFSRLKRLRLHGHSKDLDAIGNNCSLESLRLESIQVQNFDLLKSLPSLREFEFALGGVKHPTALADLDRLSHLSVFQSRGFDSLPFLAGMRGLESLKLKNLPRIREFPDLRQLRDLRRVYLDNLKSLDALAGLAKAPALHEYLHLVVPPATRPEFFLSLLDHPALRYFTAIYGTRKHDAAIRELANVKGKQPYVRQSEVTE
jgi:hypothetical protein